MRRLQNGDDNGPSPSGGLSAGLKEMVDSGRLQPSGYKPTYVTEEAFTSLATGASGSLELEKAVLAKMFITYQTFCAKQADYGSGNIAKFGERGVLVRVSDKVERLANLDKRGGVPKNEPIDDTWLDVATYGLIAMVVRAGRWPGVVGAARTPGKAEVG